MRILPIQSNQNQVSHKAVNQKYLKQARDKYYRCAPYHNQLPIIGNIVNCAIYGLISKQDAIDTLNAIRPYAGNVLDDIEDRIKDLKDSMTNQ